MENITYLPAADLMDFEMQFEIYGEVTIEPEFVASVRDMGILTPLIVTETKVGKTIISGHRRRRAAEQAGIDFLPCIVKEYESEEMMTLEFLACNMQREKSDAIRLKEFISYKQKLSQIGKARKSKGVYADTLFENEAFLRFLKTHKIEDKVSPGEPINTVEIIKKLTGFNAYEQQWLKYLADKDFLQSKFDELTNLGLSRQDNDAAYAEVCKAEAAYEAGEASLHEAASAVKDMLDDLKKQLVAARDRGKSKPQKMEKAKAEKPKLTLAVKVSVGVPAFEVGEAAKFQEYDSKADLYFEADGVKLGLMRTGNRVSGFAAQIGDDTFYLNSEVIAKILKEAV